jgi:3-methylcrotonyl-CoA carboxylase alpha subunit
VSEANTHDPWTALSGWRAAARPAITAILDDRPIRVSGTGPFTVGLHTIEHDESPGRWRVDGKPAVGVRDDGQVWVVFGGETYVFDSVPRERSVDALAGTEIVAPMPGVVLSVHARPGQKVKRGDLVCVVEAMKMELRVEAPADGTVTKVLCAQGDQVRRGQRLAEFETA